MVNQRKRSSKTTISRGLEPTDICNSCKEKVHWKYDCPKKWSMQQQKASGIVVVAEDGTHSEEDFALVVDGHTHYTDVWVLDFGVSLSYLTNRSLIAGKMWVLS